MPYYNNLNMYVYFAILHHTMSRPGSYPGSYRQIIGHVEAGVPGVPGVPGDFVFFHNKCLRFFIFFLFFQIPVRLFSQHSAS